MNLKDISEDFDDILAFKLWTLCSNAKRPFTWSPIAHVYK